MTRHVPPVNGRFLSSEVLQAGTTLKRSTYATYERDSIGLRGGSDALSYIDVNRRLQAARVIYHDDGGRFADESLSDFDGLGHYRTTVSGGNFSSGNDRTTRVNFNPSSGTYPGSFLLPSPSGPWILGTYDLQQTTEGSSSFKSTYCFDANTGFMSLKRVQGGGRGTGPGVKTSRSLGGQNLTIVGIPDDAARDHRVAAAAPPDLQEDGRLRPFGRTEPEFTWERTDKAEALRAASGVAEPVAV